MTVVLDALGARVPTLQVIVVAPLQPGIELTVTLGGSVSITVTALAVVVRLRFVATMV
jgi:hypothetical protein